MAIKMRINEHKCSWHKRFGCRDEGEYKVTWCTENFETTCYVCSECLAPFVKNCVQVGMLTATIASQELV